MGLLRPLFDLDERGPTAAREPLARGFQRVAMVCPRGLSLENDLAQEFLEAEMNEAMVYVLRTGLQWNAPPKELRGAALLSHRLGVGRVLPPHLGGRIGAA